MDPQFGYKGDGLKEEKGVTLGLLESSPHVLLLCPKSAGLAWSPSLMEKVCCEATGHELWPQGRGVKS